MSQIGFFFFQVGGVNIKKYWKPPPSYVFEFRTSTDSFQPPPVLSVLLRHAALPGEG